MIQLFPLMRIRIQLPKIISDSCRSRSATLQAMYFFYPPPPRKKWIGIRFFCVWWNNWLPVTICVRDGSDGNSQVELQLRNQTPGPGQQRGARLCSHHHPQNQVRSVVDPGHFGMDPDPQICTTGLRIRFGYKSDSGSCTFHSGFQDTNK